MPDASVEWGGDFSLSPTGDLALVDGDDFARQRIERRLLTAVRAYVWHPSYGAGLPQKIGATMSASQVSSIVRAQIALEASVAPAPAPIISVTESQTNVGLFVISIQYTDAPSGRHVSLQLSA